MSLCVVGVDFNGFLELLARVAAFVGGDIFLVEEDAFDDIVLSVVGVVGNSFVNHSESLVVFFFVKACVDYIAYVVGIFCAVEGKSFFGESSYDIVLFELRCNGDGVVVKIFLCVAFVFCTEESVEPYCR